VTFSCQIKLSDTTRQAETDGPETRYEPYRPSHDLLMIARSVTPVEWALNVVTPRPDGDSGRTLPRVHFGPVFSGEKVIVDDTTMSGLRREWPKALGVEMEGLGVAIASYRGGPGFLLVKAVCDFADRAKEDSWHGYAAEAAARYPVGRQRLSAAPGRGGRRAHRRLPVDCGSRRSGQARRHTLTNLVVRVSSRRANRGEAAMVRTT
jgi:nucleoside phosphorylase